MSARNILKIQYASNLFLANCKNPAAAVKPAAPYLALLGNIGGPYCPQTKDFFQWAETVFQRIYWIPGALEYSGGANPLTWQQRADLYYLSVRDWKLKKTVFSQKFQERLESVNIIATAGWHLTMAENPAMRIQYWNSEGSRRFMTPIDCFEQQFNELDWILRKSKNSMEPTVLLTHSPIPSRVLENHTILCHLYGAEYNERSVSATGGTNPWVGINMATAKGYRDDTVAEMLIKESTTLETAHTHPSPQSCDVNYPQTP
jgi:hypothetical protein